VGGGGYILHTTNGGTYVAITPISNVLPDEFKLYQNYPNPFNSSTKIKFQISMLGYVKIVLFDLLGKETFEMFNEKMNRGTYEIELSANELSSGVYFYKMSINNAFIDSKKLILIK